MKKLPNIIDNKRKQLLETLIEVSKDYKEISIATGYWDLKATQKLLPYIKDYKKIRLLIGREPLIPRDQLDREKPEPDYPDIDIFEDLQELKTESELYETVKELKKLHNDKVLEVKIFKTNFLHAKCYIFGNLETENAIGVIGSSNFTNAGLTKNRELNALEDDSKVVQFDPKNDKQEHGHLSWFEDIWNDKGCEDWTGKFIELLDASNHGEHIFTPYEMYIHSLYKIYSDEISSSINVSEDSEKILYEFQLRNAELLLKKLDRNGVAMLADSVGLGKTITAGAVIKKYTEDENIKKPRIEILVPASLTGQWDEELKKFHNIVSKAGDVHISSIHNKNLLDRRQEIDEYRPVDLFVIDEAHNLRNENNQRYEQIIEWIKNNEGYCHVLLLTATPINNQLSDFAHQINFASGGREDLFYVSIPKIDGRQQTIKDHYNAIIDLDKEIKKQNNRREPLNVKKIKMIMRPILQHFMVRSTRSGIEKEFGGVPDGKGKIMKFPKAISTEDKYKFIDELNVFENIEDRGLPLEGMLSKDIESIIDNRQLTKHPLDMIDKFKDIDTSDFSPVHKAFLLTTFLGLPIYRPTLYKSKFYGKSVEKIDEILKSFKKKEEKMDIKQQMTMHNMMRILYLKRAESSVYALKKTMDYYLERLSVFENFLEEENKIVRVSNLKGYAELLANDKLDDKDKENIEQISIDADPKKYKIDKLKEDIKKDKELVAVIIDILQKLVETDDKIDYFVDLLNDFKKKGKKVLVFSYFADTIDFLQQELPKRCSYINEDTAGFTSSKNNTDSELLAKRFSPGSKQYELKKDEKELQFLFSTDVLSEGQNLQDASILVNYDLHWNPVRMIQRNGRINRLGGKHKEVHIHNLCPANEIETYLKLEARLKKKIEIIKASVGTDQSILGEKDNPIEFNDEDNLELKLDIYKDGVDTDELIKKYEDEIDILATEDTFVTDLRKFHNEASEEEKDKVYNKIPNGKWGIVPKEKVKDCPFDVLANTIITIRDKEKSQEMPIFVGMPRSGQTLNYIDRLDALSILKTDKDSKNIPINFSSFKKEKIEDTLEMGVLQMAKQVVSKEQGRLKAHQERVLEALDEMGIATNLIAQAIQETSNRDDRKYLALRLRRLHEDTKLNNPLNQDTVAELEDRTNKVILKLEKEAQQQQVIEDKILIHSYHAKP
jgi:ERCC4-related helicase